MKKVDALLDVPVVDAGLILELEERKLIFALETMGRLAPSTKGVDEVLFGMPSPDDRVSPRSLHLEGKKVAIELPVHVRKSITFWSACCAGMVSSVVTHWMDVKKVLRQLGLQRPPNVRGYFAGLPMGAIAQGHRFGVTLLLNALLQERMKNLEHYEQGTLKYRSMSFGLSMFSASLGEFLANPPVVVKNWQISRLHTTSRSSWECITTLWTSGKVPIFFRGVIPGMVRKGLANAMVLQSIGPLKNYLELVARDVAGTDTSSSSSKVLISFAAGSITGSIAEVLTNHPDRVKTMMQTKKVSMWQAITEATRDPFRGAFWAGLRKGAIRGVNWGALGVFTSIFEDAYRSRHGLYID